MINIEIIRIAIFSLDSLVSFVNRHNLESSEERIRVRATSFFSRIGIIPGWPWSIFRCHQQ